MLLGHQNLAFANVVGGADNPFVLHLLYQTGGDFERAEQAYRRALQIDPSIALAYNNLAYGAGVDANRYDEALAWARKAVELQPDNPEFRDTLARVYENGGRLEQAREVLQRLVRQYPQHTEARRRLDEISRRLADSGRP